MYYPKEAWNRRKELLDWDLFIAEHWHDKINAFNDDNDRKRRRQAEFLVHRFMPTECILFLIGCSEGARQRLSVLLGSFPELKHIRVGARPSWYY